MHPIYSPTDPYQSIGMVNMTAFDLFTQLWGDVDGKPAFGTSMAVQLKTDSSDSLIQNNTCASYLCHNLPISINWNG